MISKGALLMLAVAWCARLTMSCAPSRSCGSTLERTQRQFESFATLAVAQQLAAEKLVARFAEPS